MSKTSSLKTLFRSAIEKGALTVTADGIVFDIKYKRGQVYAIQPAIKQTPSLSGVL